MSDVHFPATEPPAETDVLIVGAGPVGLSAAVELTARGVSVAVVDAATEATLVRAGAMGHSPRTVEHFRRWGVLQRIRTGWTFPPEWNRGIRLATSLLGHDLIPDGERRRPSGASLAQPIRRPQTALQQAFLDHLGLHGVPVGGGWRVTELDDTGDGVRTTVTADGQTRTIVSRYVVGADGGSSTVRRLAGIEREGEHATERMFRLIVRHPPGALGAAPSGTNIVYNQRASGFLAAMSPTEWRVYAGPYPLDVEPTEDELLDIARAAFGVADLELELASKTTYYQATRIATTFRKGRVLLAGDAAHVRTPGGNLGEGFGDVVNLGWKLAAVLAGHGGQALLDSYDAERRPHNRRVAEHALDSARRSRALLARIRADGVPDDSDDSARARRRRGEIAELLGAEPRGEAVGVLFDERYDASGVVWYEPGQHETDQPWRASVYTDDPRPGHRAPDAYVDPWGDTLYDRLGLDFGLLLTEPDAEVAEAFTTAAAERDLGLTVVHLPEGPARERYPEGAVLVRPDQHVAWRGRALPPGGAAAVLDHVLGVRAATVPAKGTTMSYFLDFTGPAELRTRGTVLIVPGRGESASGYVRLGSRLAADAYRVRVVPAPTLDEPDVDDSLDRFATVLTDAVKGLGDEPVTPLVLLGADTGAAAVANLVARSGPEAPWWPAAVVLAGLPGYAEHRTEGWEEELDGRTHCPAHRGVLGNDPTVTPGALAAPVPTRLLDGAYASKAEVPHLILTGDTDPYADRERLAQLAGILPTARLAVVRGAHHDVLNDLQHRSVAAEVVSFLEAVRAEQPLERIVQVEHSTW
ncbi:FAD-dependent oxidoreductase [Catellatospora tritici]|uniref:FAD-dependent oxidoreductase n=1 Tax=Catellatospora tritici TaxID=2851566 RepID=UPI001C2D21E7|nr:FAD-dependent oxidoreductase [Catellatospora tritici]MBV1851329.1 FAD-dependent oxidoreductase [Catellatospora tritici]